MNRITPSQPGSGNHRPWELGCNPSLPPVGTTVLEILEGLGHPDTVRRERMRDYWSYGTLQLTLRDGRVVRVENATG